MDRRVDIGGTKSPVNGSYLQAEVPGQRRERRLPCNQWPEGSEQGTHGFASVDVIEASRVPLARRTHPGDEHSYARVAGAASARERIACTLA